MIWCMLFGLVVFFVCFVFQEEDLFDIINRQKICKTIYKDRETDIRKEKKKRKIVERKEDSVAADFL